MEKIKYTPPYLFKISNTRNLPFFKTPFLETVVVAVSDTGYASTSKKNFTAQSNLFQIN